MWRAALVLWLLGCSGRRAADPGADAGATVAARREAVVAPDAASLDAAVRAAEAPPATLDEAARRCDRDAVARLLRDGASVDARNHEGRTPLHEAAGRCAPSILRPLVGHGADVNARDTDGMTPLHEACAPSRTGSGPYAVWHAGDAEVAAYLIASGADPRAVSRTGWTPLHAASQVPRGGADLVALLLDHGAAIDARDTGGWTPLHYAARFGAVDVARALVARGASLEARTTAARTVLSRSYPRGSTPLDIARASGAAGVIEVLERR